MTDDELLANYRALNESFSTPLIFHIGIDAGFFSEFSHMMHSMIFCIENKLQFRLYSADANFGHEKGWNDYFNAFCPQCEERFNHRYNVHRIPGWNSMLRSAISSRSLKPLIWKTKNDLKAFWGKRIAAKTYGKGSKLTHDVRFMPKEQYDIPELDLKGDFIAAYTTMAHIVWHLNTETQKECLKLLNTLHLPERYAGVQVRGGDKATEVELIEPVLYAKVLRKEQSLRDVLLLTDDYSIFETLKREAPDFRWFTLCQPSEHGYVNSHFSNQQNSAKRAQMVRFLAQMEGLMKASFFLGSSTSGPSNFLIKMFWPSAGIIDCDKNTYLHYNKNLVPAIKRRSTTAEYVRKLKESIGS